MKDLKFCPFCGSLAVTIKKFGTTNEVYAVSCKNCDTLGPFSPKENIAIHAWNHRRTELSWYDIHAWHGPCGALVTDKPVPRIAEKPLEDDTGRAYGGKYFIGETMTKQAAIAICQALGIKFCGDTKGEEIGQKEGKWVIPLLENKL